MILEMLQRYRLRFALGAGLLLVTNAIALCIPLLLRAAVEALRQGGDPVGRYALFIALLGGGQAVASGNWCFLVIRYWNFLKV